jgi:hypothetical protein
VLSPELELADLDARHWKNWWRLLTPPGVLDPARWALAILDRGTPSHLIIHGEGARPPLPGPAGLGPKALAAYAGTLGVSAVIVVERRLIAELSAEIEAALRLDQDLVAQGLIALRALKKHAGHGVWTSPPLLELLPAPSYEPLQRTFDLLVPDRSALVAYVIEDDRSRIHASIIAVKAHGDITRAATHRAIDDLVAEPAFARSWDKDHRRVIDAVEQRFARPSIAVFAERATLLRIVTGPSDQLARELNAKRVVIDPAPAWLLGLLGGAAVAAMAGRAATALASMLPQATRDRASALATRARDAIKDSGAHPFALLGFDPIELWSRLKHHYRP